MPVSSFENQFQKERVLIERIDEIPEDAKAKILVEMDRANETIRQEGTAHLLHPDELRIIESRREEILGLFQSISIELQ